MKEEVQDFLVEHEDEDVQKLLLKQKTVHGVPTEQIVQQIIGRRKAKSKLPSWYNTKRIVYPPGINLEQSSSESTAKFKSDFLLEHLPKRECTGVDLTGGFGIDSYFLSLYSHCVDYVEPNRELLEIAQHNHQRLGSENINYHHTSAEDFLTNTAEKFDFLFIDPSRRKTAQKVYRLTDSEPDVVAMQSGFLDKASLVLIKTSPLLDLRQGCRELQRVAEVLVVAVENECKELLFLLLETSPGDPSIRSVDLNRSGEIISSLSFTFAEEKNSVAAFSSPLTYLYEPNAAILKAGAFKWIAQKYQLKKLAPSTHLYTSDELLEFPGRTFKITRFAKADKKLKDLFPNGYANIISRNYPLSVEEIKKKTGLKEGGENYLICTQDEKEKLVMVAERLT